MSARLSTLLLVVCSMTLALSAATRGPSTAEERQRVVAITHKLEATPLDPTLAIEREWAQQWLLDVPDVRVKSCTGLLADLRRPRYKFRTELWKQLRLGSAVFLIEHPDKTGDHVAEGVAGMESVLKAYSAILKGNPDARSKSLDQLIEKQSHGKLADFVGEAIKRCVYGKDEPEPVSSPQ